MAVNVGQGAILKATISASLTAIFQCKNITGPEVTVGAGDKTNLADVIHRFRAQLPSPGKVTFAIQYDPADSTHQWIYNQVFIWPQQNVAWSLILNTLTGTAGFTFSAFITDFAMEEMNQDDDLMANVELQIDGVITSHT